MRLHLSRRQALSGRIVGIGAIFLVCIGLGAAFLVSGWDRSPRPPNEPGVCWRADMRPINKPAFTVVASDVPNIVSCAADLELAYLTEKQSITGAYQGYYIFTEPAAITGAQRLNLIHYPIFDKAERAMIDRRLRAFMQARALRPPTPKDAASASAAAS
jgi:hypothetical protein